jgi:hypothetical protein
MYLSEFYIISSKRILKRYFVASLLLLPTEMPLQEELPPIPAEETRASIEATVPSRNANSATRTRRPASSTTTISSIFNYKKVLGASKISRSNRESSLVILNETRPLSLFYFADKNLYKAIKSLKASRSASQTPSFVRKNERVHRLQKHLLVFYRLC